MHRMLIAIAAWLVLAAGCPRAHADELKTQARRDMNAGLAAHKAGRYGEAIELYRRAYEAVPHPEILFDLGQASRLHGDAAGAVDYYRRYLAVEPRGRASADARRWIVALDGAAREQLAREAAERAERAEREAEQAREAAELDRLAEQTLRALETREAAGQRAAAEASLHRAVARARAESGASRRGTYAAIAAVAGGGAIAGGLAFGHVARTRRDAAIALCGADRRCDTDEDTATANGLLADSRLRGHLATGFAAAGAAAVVAGALLWWRRGRPAAAITAIAPIAPITTGAPIGLALGRRF